MNRKKLLQRIFTALSTDKDIAEVWIKYQSGAEIKFDLENENTAIIQPADDEDEEDEDYEENAVQAVTCEDEEENEDDED
jgi:hypothetical protein